MKTNEKKNENVNVVENQEVTAEMKLERAREVVAVKHSDRVQLRKGAVLAFEEEYRSLGQLLKVMGKQRDNEAVVSYLASLNITFEQATDKNYFWKGLKVSTFVNSLGESYEAPCRIDRVTKEPVQRRWSFSMICQAAEKVTKEAAKALIKEAEKAEKEAKAVAAAKAVEEADAKVAEEEKKAEELRKEGRKAKKSKKAA